MSGKESDVVLNFKTSGEVQYAKTIKEINQQMNLAATEYKNQLSAMDKDATETEKLTAAKRKLEKQVELASGRTKQLREEYNKSVQETGKYSAESEKLYKKLLESQTGENKLKDALEKTNEALKEQGDLSVDTANKIQKIEEAGDKITGVGKKMSVGITAPIVALGAASYSSFVEVDEGLDLVAAKTGATGDKLKSLQGSFKNVAADAPDTFTDIGIAVGDVNTRLGLTGDKLEEAAGDFLTFAYVNETDLQGSIESVTRAMGDAGMEADDYGKMLDYLTVAHQTSGISVDKLSDNLVKFGPSMRALGFDTKNSIALFAGFEKAGVNTESMLAGLKKSTATWGAAGKDANAEFEKTMTKIKEAPNATEATSAAMEAFGNKAGRDLAEAIRGGRFEVDDYIKALEDAGGAMNDTYDQMADPKDDVVNAMNSLKTTLHDLAEVALNEAAPYIKDLVEHLKKLQDWFTNLSPEAKKMIIFFAGFVAAVGPVLVVLGTLAGSVKKIVTMFKLFSGALSLVTSPVGLIVLALAALVAGLVYAYMKVDWFRKGVNTFFQGVSDVAVEVFNFIGGFISGVFEGVWTNISNIFNSIKRIFTGFIDFITGVFTGNWSKAWQGLVNIFGGIFDGIVAVGKAPVNAMIGLINGFIGGLNKIKIPKWVPGIGGKSFSISKLPYLAQGGHLLNGQAIVGEAGPELLSNKNGKTTVTPLSAEEKRRGIGGKVAGGNIEQHIHIGKVDANNPSELDRMNRKFAQANRQAIYDLGGELG